MSPLIRISDEVYAELQRRAKAFEDTPNSVIQKVLGLAAESREPEGERTTSEMDSMIAALVTGAGVPLSKVTLIRGRLYRLRSKSGKVVANIERQPRKCRVWIAAPKGLAQSQGLSWEKDSPGGWYGADDQVYWYVPDGDNAAAARGTYVLQKLY